MFRCGGKRVYMCKILTSFQIKIIALILMVFDHLHYMFIDVINFPLWFHMMGRLSAPLFIFCTANGMRHTRNPKKYLLRLYIGFLFMSIFNRLFNQYITLPSGGILINNIFGTLFIIALFIYCMQQIISLRKGKKSYIKYVLLMLIPIISAVIVDIALTTGQVVLFRIIFTFVPDILSCEGGLIWIILGVGMYLCKTNKSLSIFYILISLFLLYTGMPIGMGLKTSISSLFTYNIQWMMIFALPIMLMYNGKRGRSMKYFFYIFYPLHVYGFAFLAKLIAK